MKTAAVVIPTYNEVESIGRMADILLGEIFPSIPEWRLHLVVVDGDSPDGTADVVRKRTTQYPELHLIVEKDKEGIGAAYFKGFEYAIDQLGADVLIEFDGDFQHPPESICDLLDAIDSGADLVLGSRRIRGGSYPHGWRFKRLFLSRFGGFVIRLLLFFPGVNFFRVTDPTTGLKATRVAGCYDGLELSLIRSSGFGYKVEMLYHLVLGGAKVSEIPLKFGLREAGESKITGQTPSEIMFTALRLRRDDPDTRRFVKFGLVGFAGFLVNAVALELFARASWAESLASKLVRLRPHPIFGFASRPSSWAAAAAAELAILHNYVFNDIWVFRRYRARRWGKFFLNMVKFNLTSFGAILLQFLCVGMATFVFSETTVVRQIALLLTIVLVIVPYNWLMYNHVIWRTGRTRQEDQGDKLS